MKHNILFIAIALCLALTSCDKMPENGDLEGLWQLMEITQDGETKNVKAEHLYCSFQLKLFMLEIGEKKRAYFGRFEYKGATLRFHSFTYRSDYSGSKQSADRYMTDDADLQVIAPWGFYSTDCTFQVQTLTDDIMVLTHGNLVVTYRKI